MFKKLVKASSAFLDVLFDDTAKQERRAAEARHRAEEAQRRTEEVRKAEEARRQAEAEQKIALRQRLIRVLAEEAKQRAKEELIKREIIEKTGITPTKSQWQMILTRSVNTYVVAGAGSGKSTSLILRVLVLHHYQKIPLHQITVFSFTRKSTQDFRQKLQTVFRAFGYTVSDKDARQVVRTFHSKILELTRGMFSQSQIFEFLAPGHDLSSPDDVGLFESSLNDTQEQYLKNIYRDLFQTNEQFRLCILALYIWYLKQLTLKKAMARFKLTDQVLKDLQTDGVPEYIVEGLNSLKNHEAKSEEDFLEAVKKYIGAEQTTRYKERILKFANMGEEEKDYTEYVINIASRRDRAVTAAVASLFESPASAIPPRSLHLSGIYSQYEFYANAYLPELDCYLVYIPQLSVLGDRKDEKIENFPLAACLSVKQKILLKFAEEDIIFIHNEKDMRLIAEQAKWFQHTAGKVPPNFPYAPEGEPITPQIWMSFYNTAQFIENMGLEVQRLKTAGQDWPLSLSDRFFLQALLLFWAAFTHKLKEDRIGRFHDLFTFFSEHQLENFQKLSMHAVESMSHILIDEFQDISPEVVYWIRGLVKHQHSLGLSTSLMCVGDDWQSIYGWRGSSPSYFIDYSQEFPDGEPCRIDMTENFRSYQDIIDHGEKVLQHVRYKTEKHGIAMRNNGSMAVQLFRLNDDHELLPLLQTILEQEAHHQDQELMVLSRSNDTVNRIRKAIQKKFKVKMLTTFHQSKGLEADVCILVGDCAYTNVMPLKNLIYQLAGFKQTYDAAQHEEARRLAYVGITRARNRCYWLAVPRLDGAFEILSPPEPKKVLVYENKTDYRNSRDAGHDPGGRR